MTQKKTRDGGSGEHGHVGVIEITTWRDFVEIAAGSTYRNWAFRGQADARWHLFSALSRYLRNHGVHPEAWADQEERIYRIFRRKAHLFLDHIPAETDAFQWLALMQHHGAPTRLVDFTWSPYVALFYAFERATSDAAVWAVSFPQVWRATYEFPGHEKPVTRRELDLRLAGTYERHYLRNEVAFVSTGEPQIMNQRLVAQSGTFVVPGILDRPVEDILSDYPNPAQTVVKFVLKTKSFRDEAMLQLYTMNITNATLFPDLDGLARSMAYELEYRWDYSPKTLKKNPGYEDLAGPEE